MTIERKQPDLSRLSLDGTALPAAYVESSIMWRNADASFSHIIRQLEAQPYPGFFFTTAEEYDLQLRVRHGLNRHAVYCSEIFRDSKEMIYRDVDAKGVGYVFANALRVVPVRYPEMRGDMELRGIQDYEFAVEDWLNAEEMNSYGFRVAVPVALVELYKLVDKDGDISPRNEFLIEGNDRPINLDKTRPMITFRAMGTTSRAGNLSDSGNESYDSYQREIIEDAIGLVSLELGDKLTYKDYAVWFTDTLAGMLGKMHSLGISPDFRRQIHGGSHNVTLDCRLVDMHLYETPGSMQRMHDDFLRRAEENKGTPTGELYLSQIESHFNVTPGQAEENLRLIEKMDRDRALYICSELVRKLDIMHGLGSLKREASKMFGKAYGKGKS